MKQLVASAGMIVALLFAMIAFFAWRKKYVELYTALIPTIAVQAAYGAYETIFWQLPDEQFLVYAVPIAVISAIVGLAISIYILYKALKERLKTINQGDVVSITPTPATGYTLSIT